MSDTIPVAELKSIRDTGRDEYWLQQRIWENPTCLGLGDLTALDKERRQGSGGRLDILLKDDDDDAMYEVEVMLGETDETHIIRTIEYWDNEKRRWPQRQHFPVLVAENFNRRFFNVIYLLSQSIPLIAIRASILQVGVQQILHFAKVVEIYEEEEDGASIEPAADRKFWVSHSPSTLAIAEKINDLIVKIEPSTSLSFTKSYIAIGAKRNYMWIKSRKGNAASIEVRISDIHADAAQSIFEKNGITSSLKRGNFKFTIQGEQIVIRADLLLELAKLATS